MGAPAPAAELDAKRAIRLGTEPAARLWPAFHSERTAQNKLLTCE
jgi:hypothetical protein